MASVYKKQKKKGLIFLIVVVSILVIAIACCVIYLNDYYRADNKAINAFTTEHVVTKQLNSDNSITYKSEKVEAGFIFYPGGKVEHTAYEPLMETLASKGIMCVLVEMPFRLAVLDIDAAEGIQEKFPNIKKWYIGGHSFGGAMAATYLSKGAEDFQGLVLLGAYTTEDLSETPLEVLSIYGSEDRVLNFENYEDNKGNLPNDFKEVVIDGGCHAYFGMYGMQAGDGVPRISNEEQIEITGNEIGDFMLFR